MIWSSRDFTFSSISLLRSLQIYSIHRGKQNQVITTCTRLKPEFSIKKKSCKKVTEFWKLNRCLNPTRRRKPKLLRKSTIRSKKKKKALVSSASSQNEDRYSPLHTIFPTEILLEEHLEILLSTPTNDEGEFSPSSILKSLQTWYGDMLQCAHEMDMKKVALPHFLKYILPSPYNVSLLCGSLVRSNFHLYNFNSSRAHSWGPTNLEKQNLKNQTLHNYSLLQAPH